MLKEMLCSSKGSDPVMIKMDDPTGPVKILCSSILWVNSTNDLVKKQKRQFPDRLEITIKSLDSNIN